MELGGTQRKLQKLSKEFVVHCRKDISKKCVLFPKLVLQSLNVWPDNDDMIKRWLMVVVIVSLNLMCFAHIAYLAINVTDISKMTSACTTVVVVIETIAKLMTMMMYKKPLNAILTSIWLDFWPSKVASKYRQKQIQNRSRYVITVGVTFLVMAFFSNAQFMAFPIVANTDQLPLASWYPFNFKSTPQYQLMYIWQWFMNQVVISTLSGFDAFFNSLVMICSTQFQILQDVLENLCCERGWKQRAGIAQMGRRDSEMVNLITCVEHHLLLLEICALLEKIFSHIVFLQFVVSTLAMCVSCVALIADPSLWQHMLSYLIAHVFQFFIYCSVGNELTYQSGQIADAAYYCDWHLSQDIDFRKGLMLMIQRAQKPVSLTVSGRMQLSYANFIATVHLSFSFYTLLNTFV
ncbi:PREDICTED: odorant receptor 82a-like [Nicrophorus vespilloides]|uniref:Odorant receptor n=1 Tax=Nicrophorus vespilloides TaxID=110193 RepID=A0ABM1M0M3_NICVS|nr:PREDICTED: odorant receptor 82a-like [Nicrophorus vespilloides]